MTRGHGGCLLAILLVSAPVPGRADRAPAPPRDCPAGSIPRSGARAGSHCQAFDCGVRGATCPDGTSCSGEPLGLCVVEVGAARTARGTCGSSEDDCPGASRCELARRCLPLAAGAGPSGGAVASTPAGAIADPAPSGACASGCRASPAGAGLVGAWSLGWLVVRRRRGR